MKTENKGLRAFLRGFAVLLLVASMLSFSGCNSPFVDEELEAYTKAVNDFFTAVKNDDADAVYNLFSPYVQNKRTDLKDNIEELLSIYDGTYEKIGDFSLLAGESTREMGKSYQKAYTTFPILSDGEYYWIYLELMYENDFDEDRLGVTQIDFLTADAYCEFWSSAVDTSGGVGLNIYNKTSPEYNVVAINTNPYDYHPGEPLDIQKVKAFFEKSYSIIEFKKEFGEPAAKDELSIIYPLPDENGECRYLDVSYDDDGIFSCDVVSDFSWVEDVLEK